MVLNNSTGHYAANMNTPNSYLSYVILGYTQEQIQGGGLGDIWLEPFHWGGGHFPP